MKVISAIIFTLCLLNVNAQEKQLDRNAQQAKLATTQTEILQLEEKIENIEGRVAATPPQDVHPNTQEELDRLKNQLTKLKRVEFSIKSYLEESVDKKSKEPKKD